MGFFLLKVVPDLPVIKKPFREGYFVSCLVNFFQHRTFSLSANTIYQTNPTYIPDIVTQQKTILLAEDNLMNQVCYQKLRY
jgi:hypothetical protein